MPAVARSTRRPSARDLLRLSAYGAALALGVLLLDWLDYERRVRLGADWTLAVAALAFLILGIWFGARALARPKLAPFDSNPKALAALNISPRELEVLIELAAGRSNKEIARRLAVSPNTIKTHASRLFSKLGAARRTDAIARARALGLIP